MVKNLIAENLSVAMLISTSFENNPGALSVVCDSYHLHMILP